LAGSDFQGWDYVEIKRLVYPWRIRYLGSIEFVILWRRRTQSESN
jgi:hypothetical protein